MRITSRILEDVVQITHWYMYQESFALYEIVKHHPYLMDGFELIDIAVESESLLITADNILYIAKLRNLWKDVKNIWKQQLRI